MLAKKPRGGVQKRQSGGSSSLLWSFFGAVVTIIAGVAVYLWNPFDLGSEESVEERVVEPINQQPVTQTENYEFYDLLPDQEMISLPDEAILGDTRLPDENVRLQPDVVLTHPEPKPKPQPTETQRQQSAPAESGSEGYGVAGEVAAAPTEQAASSAELDIVIVEEEGSYDNPAASQAAVQPKQSYILQINSYSNAEEADKRRAQVLLAGVDAKVVKNTKDNGQVLYQVVSSTMTSKQAVAIAQQRLQNNGIDSLIVEQRR